MDHTLTIRPELLTLSRAQLTALGPYFWVFGGSIVTILLSVLRVVSPKWPVFIATLATAVAAIAAASGILHDAPQTLFNGMMAADGYSNFFNIIFAASAACTALASFRYLDREGLQHPEYFVLLLFSALGMMIMTAALDLIVVFIALEIMSLAIYALVGFRRADRRSNEAAIKYYVLGSAASAVLLYGAAMIYGATQSTNVRTVLELIQAHPETMTPLFTLGSWLVGIGFLFKVAAMPFHMWMPDVYEGAPTPITGFMTTGLKAAAFASFVRIFVSLGYGKGLTVAVQGHLHDVLWACAAITMLFGNLIALTQKNLKRMLAYSSIAHTGYLLVGIIAGANGEQGYGPVVLYLLSYSIMNLGAFAILSLLSERGDLKLDLQDLAGLATRRPWLAFALSVFMFSMAGIPPTAGFAAKYLLLYSAVQAHETVLVVISVLCSAISVYYYLRVLVFMYMRDAVGGAPVARVSVWSAAVVAAMVVMTVQIGVLPARMMAAAKRAVTSF